MSDSYKDFVIQELEMAKIKIKAREEEREELKKQISRFQINLNKLNQSLSQSRREIDILNKKCILFKRERDCYKNFIASYEEEINYNYKDNLDYDKFVSLEKSLTEYRSLVEKLQEAIKMEKNGNHVDCLKENRRLQNEFNNINEIKIRLEEEIKTNQVINKENESKLLATIDDLQSQLCEANEKIKSLESQKQINLDDFEIEDIKDMKKLKVIHYQLNPADKCIKENIQHYHQLKEENKKLCKRLELIESGSFQDITRIVQEEVNYLDEIENLKSKLSIAEEQHQKILIESKKISKEFREIVYKLTGYKMDIVSQKVYKLSNIYAEGESDYLLFTKDESGVLQLLKNSYSDQLTELIEIYLNQYDSFPAFLASLTLNLLKHQTLVS